VTSGNCAGVENGIWALDLGSKNVTNHKGTSVGTAFGPNNMVYATMASGDLIALEAKSLMQKATYAAGKAFTTWPVVLESDGKVLVAAATSDGTVHVVDGGSLSKVAMSPAASNGGAVLAAWKDATGTSWILNGRTAWKLSGGALQSGWSAQNIGAPISAAVINGVVFLATAGGPSAHATLYALDARSGKQLWSSGNTITSYIAPGGGLAAGGSSVYLGTNDGNLWAFGFPIEH
jgi:outer membrane protein assembly factor BamB